MSDFMRKIDLLLSRKKELDEELYIVIERINEIQENCEHETEYIGQRINYENGLKYDVYKCKKCYKEWNV